MSSIAAAMATDGEALAVWSVRPKGASATQAYGAIMSVRGAWQTPVQLSPSLCTPGVAAAILPDGTAAAGFGTKSSKGCELTVSLRPPNGLFAPPMPWTSGAHISVPVAVGTTGGNFAISYNDTMKAAVFAITGNSTQVGTVFQLGQSGTPSLAAGGGQVSAVWCSKVCYGSLLTLP